MKLSFALIILAPMVLFLSGCGGSSGADASTDDTGVIANDSVNTVSGNEEQIDGQQMADLQNDASEQASNDASCEFEFDVADLLLTEADRQWSCEIVSDQASTYEDVYFQRHGTAIFGNELRYWNRNLPFEQINIASPITGRALIKDIRSSNTLMSFILTPESGTNLLYECVLTPRETAS